MISVRYRIGRALGLASLVALSTVIVATVVAEDSRNYLAGIAAESSICPSGQSSARLTGWMLNNKTPMGTATYTESGKNLEVTVSAVNLPDGTRLSVLDGENRIGELSPLKSGE